MYLRCSTESKPAWNGNNRALFQNNSSQRLANMTRRMRSTHRVVDSLKLICHRNTKPKEIATRTIQNGQIFLNASIVPLLSAIELPALGNFAVAAKAA